MKYDFTSIMNRSGMDAIAVDGLGLEGAPASPGEGFDIIPMWVADMNFPTVPTVPEAITARTNAPHYGYFSPREEYVDAILKWQKTRNKSADLTGECIGYENGVLGGVISALNVFCSRGDNVLLHSPTYIGFTESLCNNGYHIVHSPLALDGNGVYRYRIYAAYETGVREITYRLNITESEKKEEFIRFGIEHSLIDTGVKPGTEDKVVTLSTCTGNGYSTRWVVQAVRELQVTVHPLANHHAD